jgi:hypothetical protein
LGRLTLSIWLLLVAAVAALTEVVAAVLAVI